MILLWGEPEDPPLRQVAHCLTRSGLPHHRVRDFRGLRVRVGERVTGRLRCDGGDVALEDVGGVYLRPLRRFHVEASASEAALDEIGGRNATAFLAWTEVTPARVVNRYSAMASNTSKPYQLGLIAKAGFAVPETIVTTTPDEVLRFWRHHGAIIYKSTSGIRSRVERFGEGQLARLGRVVACPTLFQRWIDGVDIRVHVVGEETFATEVSAEADDYRFPRGGPTPLMRSVDLPADIARRCVEVAASMNLAVAGLDLRVDAQGRWYCFEVNPSPAFTYYSDATGQPIAAAVADLLAAGARLAAGGEAR